MKYNTILFDLDGTLTDPQEGLVNANVYALKEAGLPPLAYETLVSFIGPPLLETYESYLGLSKEKAWDLHRLFRVYFEDRGWRENQIFVGIAPLLQKLQQAGATVVMATSKPEKFAKDIAKHFGITPYFHLIAGSTMDETRTKKGDVIAYALEQLPQVDLASCVMIGDRKHDVIGGQSNEMDTIGVLYGFGDRQELEDAGATHIVETVDELEAFLWQA